MKKDRAIELNLFEYADYRLFLGDYYAKKKAVNPGYSHRVFARQAGLSSPSHLLMIIKGNRNLSVKTIHKFAEGLNLSAREKKFFELLVLFNQADDLQMKAKYFADIMTLKAQAKGLHQLEKEKFDFLSKWYVVAVYVLLDLKDFDPSPDWIARKLAQAITPAQAREALDNLEKLKLIARDDAKGYRQVSGAVSVPDDTRSVAVYNYHQSMIGLAAASLRKTDQARREVNGATIAIPASKLPELKEKIRAFRKEINQLASSYADADQIYQLNVQFFPLTAANQEAEEKDEK